MLQPHQWKTKLLPGVSPQGESILTILCKGTFSLKQDYTAEITNKSIPFHEEEQWIGGSDPVLCPPRCEPDCSPLKARTDILIHGRAFAPEGKRARFFDLTVAINDIHYQIRVCGNRQVVPTLTSFTFSEPELFETMPLHYGLAYGGCDALTNPDLALFYPRNPLGKGFVVDPTTKDLIGLALPNLENPAQLLTPGTIRVGRMDHWMNAQEPRALGIAPKHSNPRNSTGPGSLGFWNAAPPRLCFPTLWGDENITLTYMDKNYPKFSFTLPGITPIAWLHIGCKQQKYMLLQTLEIFKEANLMTMVWGAEFPTKTASTSEAEIRFGVV